MWVVSGWLLYLLMASKAHQAQTALNTSNWLVLSQKILLSERPSLELNRPFLDLTEIKRKMYFRYLVPPLICRIYLLSTSVFGHSKRWMTTLFLYFLCLFVGSWLPTDDDPRIDQVLPPALPNMPVSTKISTELRFHSYFKHNCFGLVYRTHK